MGKIHVEFATGAFYFIGLPCLTQSSLWIGEAEATFILILQMWKLKQGTTEDGYKPWQLGSQIQVRDFLDCSVCLWLW